MAAPDIHILSVGTALPGPPVSNAELVDRFDMPKATEQWLETFVGTRARHFGFDLATGEIRHTLADTGTTAGLRALAGAGMRAADVELMVLGTASPDQLMPATVNVIADRLGIDGVPTYQLQSGCTGAVQALDVAYHMLLSGRCRTALVLGADSCAKHFDPLIDPAGMAPSEQVNGMLFGDGAGALVLARDPGPESALLHRVYLRLEGLGRPPGQVIDWYGRAGGRGAGQATVNEDYKAIEESVPKLAAEVLDALLDELDWPETDVDYLLPPQLSGTMTERITASLGLAGAQEVSRVAEIGNNGNALPFFQLERALPQMTTGDRAIAIAIESSKWIKSGFALEKT